MSDKADGFTVFHARCGRKLGIYIAVIGEEYIGCLLYTSDAADEL